MNRGTNKNKEKIGAKEVILIAIIFVILLYFIIFALS